MEYEKIVLVTRKTRLDGLVERFNTRGQAKFYIEHSGGDFSVYEREHEVYYAALRTLRANLAPIAKVQEIERSFLPNFMFSETDLVVTIGIDGLVVNTAKYLNGQPLIAVNPDPAHIDGILLPFNVETAALAASRVRQGRFQERKITMAEARLQDGQRLLAFNDLFIGARTHISARYRIRVGEREERHSSSGIIVSTGVGSTGWLSSLFNMANGMLNGFSPEGKPLPALRLAWDAEQLIFVVREPFISKTSGAVITCGQLSADSPLLIESEMPEGGVIFSDGVEADFLAFNAGAVAWIGVAEKKTRLVI
ncbi:MAG: NAD+ kinase [Anaerolineae bacterium]|nr:MAG: NAD+ kinase [Anaerolineae bacterium]